MSHGKWRRLPDPPDPASPAPLRGRLLEEAAENLALADMLDLCALRLRAQAKRQGRISEIYGDYRPERRQMQPLTDRIGKKKTA